MDREQLIWEYLNNPTDKILSKMITDLKKSDAEFETLFESINAFDNRLKSNPILEMDKSASVNLEESILASIQNKSQRNDYYLLLILPVLIITATLLYYAFQMTPIEPDSTLHWASSIKSLPESFAAFKSASTEMNIDLNWSYYVILVIPLILLWQDILMENYIKTKSMKLNFLF